MKNRAVFLDRDGTLIQERGHISRISQVKFIKGAFRAIKTLKELGFKLIIVSNQSGVARGIISEAQVRKVNAHISSQLQKRGMGIDKIYYCPHHPRYGGTKYRKQCRCRKPAPAMIRQAQKTFRLTPRESYVIGDKLSDLKLADNVGAKGILVLTGYGRESREKLNRRKPNLIARNIWQAARWISSQENGSARIYKKNREPKTKA